MDKSSLMTCNWLEKFGFRFEQDSTFIGWTMDTLPKMRVEGVGVVSHSRKPLLNTYFISYSFFFFYFSSWMDNEHNFI